MKSKAIIIGISILLVFILLSLSYQPIIADDKAISNSIEEKSIIHNHSIKCSNNYYLFCNISVNGHILYAKNQIGIIGNELHILFFIDNRTDPDFEYGFASIDGILRNHDFRYVLGVVLYGFNGNASWENIVEDTDILVEGSAFFVRVSYHGSPLWLQNLLMEL